MKKVLLFIFCVPFIIAIYLSFLGMSPAIIGTAGGIPGSSSGSWVTVIDESSNWTSEYTDNVTQNYRMVVPSGTTTSSGTKVRVTFSASSTTDANITGAAIGINAGSGAFTTTPTRITFNSGSNGATVTAGTSLLSDEITFSWPSGDSVLVSFYTTARNFKYDSNSNAYNYYDSNATDESQDVSPSMTYGSTWKAIAKIEIWVP